MHTPGPWKIRPHDLMQRIQNTDGHTVAIPAMNDGVSALECSANARLIAKAPDLLVALAWALDQIEDDLDPDHQAALAHARSLLEA